MRASSIPTVLALFLCACGANRPASPHGETLTSDAERAGTQQESEKRAIDPGDLDPSVRPQDDFWRYVNGRWIDRTEIPADKASWGSFVALNEQASRDVREIIEDLAQRDDLADGSPEQLVRDLYRSFMDTERLAELGMQPIRADLDRIAAISSKEELAATWGALARRHIATPLTFFVSQDSKNPTAYAVFVTQDGLGLPDRDDYGREGAEAAAVREAYRTYLERLFEESGDPDPTQSVLRAYGVEEWLAAGQWTRVQNRDSEKTYNKLSSEAMRGSARSLPWEPLLAALSLDEISEFIVRQPSYLTALGRAFDETPLEDWKAYFRARLLTHAAPYLTESVYAAYFEYQGRTLFGQEQPSPRWKRGVGLVNRQLGQAVGREYVRRHFPPQAKERMRALVANLRAALGESLSTCRWMSPETKARALDKLAKFTPKIGYPDHWRDYTGLEIHPDDLIGNLDRIEAFDYAYQLGKLGGPIRRDEWFMSPQTVNAYYNPRLNEIVFPAAILQPPFFDLEADDAVNYGGIGTVIGHEMGHGFDDQGRKFDGDGMLRDWWTQADAAEYEARAQRLRQQYEGFFPLPDLHINGALTMGENIGDLNGLTIAWRAYHHDLHGRRPPLIDGLSGDERFFINFAQIWRSKFREEALRQQIQTNPHSPPEFRVRGTLMNFTPFYETFAVHEGDGMWRDPADRVEFF